MKNRIPKSNPYENREEINASIEKKKMNKNLMRLGGGGLSLEAFANAKTKSNHYNPALISIFTFLNIDLLFQFHHFVGSVLFEIMYVFFFLMRHF